MQVLLCHLYEKIYRPCGTMGKLCGCQDKRSGDSSKTDEKGARGHVMISSVTDPYQPMEEKYKLTRRCLEVLLPHQFSVDILTKSPLVLRDLDLLKKFKEMEVGITITTDDDEIRKIFEPNAPPIEPGFRL